MKENKQTLSKSMMIMTFLGLYLLSAGSSWAIFSYLKEDPDAVKASKNVAENRSRLDPGLPRTESCPINGKMYSKPERDIWETRRPITAIIENHLESRPQSGLSKADIVYEAVAEGGITRFLAVYYCGAAAEEVKIAPIRSVRVYFLDWAAEYGEKPLFVHIGGANNICGHCPGGVKPRGQIVPEANAFAAMEKLGWRSAKGNGFDGGTNIGYPIIVRDQYRLGSKSAWEHSVVAFTDKIYDEAKVRGFGYELDNGNTWDSTFTSWKFKDENPSSSPSANQISINFGSRGDYDVLWKYSAENNNYLRVNGSKDHTDNETKEQISAKNVVVLYMEFKPSIDQEGHAWYKTTGRGDALIFQDGKVIRGAWQKTNQMSKTIILDDKGKEIEFVKGEIWISAVPKGNKVNY
jgi:hypothetical protein